MHHYGIYTQRTWVTIDLRKANNPLLISSSRNDNAYTFFTLGGKYVCTLYLPNLYACHSIIDDNKNAVQCLELPFCLNLSQ